jgi:hypothetical protein
MHAVEHALLFKIRDVLVDGGKALKPHAASDFLKGWGVSVAGHKRLKKIQNLFLPAGDGHARIIANKKRIDARKFLPSFLWGNRILNTVQPEAMFRTRKST